MRNKFDMQLDSLKEQLTNMGELCEVAITKATEAILEGKEEQAREVILRTRRSTRQRKTLRDLSEASAPAAAGRKRPQKNLSST